MIKIRLARFGRKKKPFYRIVVANEDAPRDGKYIEKIGTYDPMLENTNPSRVTMKDDRVSYWLQQGAQPTNRVLKIIGALSIKLPRYIQKQYEGMIAKQKISSPKNNESPQC